MDTRWPRAGQQRTTLLWALAVLSVCSGGVVRPSLWHPLCLLRFAETKLGRDRNTHHLLPLERLTTEGNDRSR